MQIHVYRAKFKQTYKIQQLLVEVQTQSDYSTDQLMRETRIKQEP